MLIIFLFPHNSSHQWNPADCFNWMSTDGEAPQHIEVWEQPPAFLAEFTGGGGALTSRLQADRVEYHIVRVDCPVGSYGELIVEWNKWAETTLRRKFQIPTVVLLVQMS